MLKGVKEKHYSAFMLPQLHCNVFTDSTHWVTSSDPCCELSKGKVQNLHVDVDNAGRRAYSKKMSKHCQLINTPQLKPLKLKQTECHREVTKDVEV